jgi:hypothetical protein
LRTKHGASSFGRRHVEIIAQDFGRDRSYIGYIDFLVHIVVFVIVVIAILDLVIKRRPVAKQETQGEVQ